jgi:hypothetical protein
MTLDFKFGDGQIIEYEILPDAKAHRLMALVVDAISGELPIDCIMTKEWAQGSADIIDAKQLTRYLNGVKGVGIRDYKSRGIITPPVDIIKLRRKNNRKVKRALEELYKHDIITQFTIRDNGYMFVEWFDGYVELERGPTFEKWHVGYLNEGQIIEDDNQSRFDYLKERLTYAHTNYEAMRQNKERTNLRKRMEALYGMGNAKS